MQLNIHFQNYWYINFLSINKNTSVMKNEMSVVSEQLALLMTKLGGKKRKKRKIGAVVGHDWNRMPWQY
jgi:hypothetical protein